MNDQQYFNLPHHVKSKDVILLKNIKVSHLKECTIIIVKDISNLFTVKEWIAILVL